MRRVKILTSSSKRYPSNSRPQDWDNRVAGYDTITTTDNEELTLFSDGQQSPPKPGWTILLTEPLSPAELQEASIENAYKWTLYGMS